MMIPTRQAEALADLDMALQLDPKDLSSLLDRGLHHHYSTKDYDKAIADYTQAYELLGARGLKKLSANPLRSRAEVFLLTKKNDKALADANECIELDSENGKNYLVRSKVYAALDDADKAKADRVKAIQLDPDLADK